MNCTEKQWRSWTVGGEEEKKGRMVGGGKRGRRGKKVRRLEFFSSHV